MAYVTRVRREQISVDELVRRVQADDVRQSEVDRVERRVRAAIAADRRRANPVRWLIAASGGMVTLSVFGLVSLAFGDRPADSPALPEVVLWSATPEVATFTGNGSATVSIDSKPVATATIVRKMTAPSASTTTTSSSMPQYPPYWWFYGPYGGYWGPSPTGTPR